jgi:hypothetical protein
MTLSTDLKRYVRIKTHKEITKRYSGFGGIQRINGKVYFQTKNHFFKYSKEQEQFFEDKTGHINFMGIKQKVFPF